MSPLWEATTLCRTWFCVICPYGALCHPCERQGRRKKRKNHTLQNVVFSWFAHTGLYVTPLKGKEGGKNEKTTLCKTWFFRGLPIRASMSPLWEARKEEKTKKPHFAKCGFFVVCPYGPLCHPSGRQGRRRKRKKHTLQNVVFSWFAHTGLYVTPLGGKEGGKNEKNTFCKTWFFRGLPIRASMSPL